MTKEPKTSIWRNSPSGQTLIKTRPLLPSPIPKIGQIVIDPEFGETECSGVSSSGSNENIIEVKLTIL